MADELKTIVQRMVDAGESEANIGTVIQHFNRTHAAQPSLGQMLENRPIDEAGNPIEPTGHMADLIGALKPVAHPQSAGDFLQLLTGTTALGEAPQMGRNIRQLYRATAEAHPDQSMWQVPLNMLRGRNWKGGWLDQLERDKRLSEQFRGKPVPSAAPTALSPIATGGDVGERALQSERMGRVPVASHAPLTQPVTPPMPTLRNVELPGDIGHPPPGVPVGGISGKPYPPGGLPGIGTASPELVQAHTEALHNTSANARDALRAAEAEHPISVAGQMKPPPKPTRAPFVQTPQQWQAADQIQAVASHRASMGGMQSAARAYKTPQELAIEALKARLGIK